MHYSSTAATACSQTRGGGVLAVALPLPRTTTVASRTRLAAAAAATTNCATATAATRIDAAPLRKLHSIVKQTPTSTTALPLRGYVATCGFASPGAATRQSTRALSQPATRRSVVSSSATTSMTPSLSTDDCESYLVLSDGRNARPSSRKKLPLNLSRIDSDAYYPMLPPPPPHLQDRHLLLLDLDETLVHTLTVDLTASTPNAGIRRAPSVAGNQCNTRLFLTPDEGGINDTGSVALEVHFRPHVAEFLEFVAQRFEVGVFTASRRRYADCIIDALEAMISRRKVQGSCGLQDDACQVFGSRRLYREHCCDLQGQKIKDLSLLGRPLHRVALVDNSSFAYHLQPRNGIPIPSWYGSPQDKELIRLMPLLQKLQHAGNVVTVLDDLDS